MDIFCRDLRAGGSTDFVSVFNKLQDMLVKVEQEEQPQGLWEPSGIEASGLSLDKNNSTYVLMMTDGCDTVNNQQQIDKAKEKLQVAIEGYGGKQRVWEGAKGLGQIQLTIIFLINR